MHKDVLVITNNPKVQSRYAQCYTVRFVAMRLTDVLFAARDAIHLGYHLLSHPMTGSLKPNQTPYKTVVLFKGQGTTHAQSVIKIEQAIENTEKFLRCRATPQWGERAIEDFQTVDLSFIQGAIDNHHEIPKRRYTS